MTKDEIKNRISMALKDSILQQGFEIICKENSTLDKSLITSTKNNIERQRIIDELKEENAELKKELEMSNKVYNENLDYSHHIEGQLTKAREIILKLYNAGRDVLMCRAEEKVYDNLSEAINDRSIEQFLKEVSE